ncbi:RNA polymerase factor sigma-54 [Roseateles depolymerans]|uniref:RNA polymerase sigma-54 factor n=1 Tax=Roseateles depolymerans TaxID=76731 RepID=A0A0U3NAA7_9BURK|nr:RNA polymerase factor sigma-54 [Roseateles depolymerans]ALV09083.1 RNA polymerase sigma-54 factor [Roseateles depolymerans]REG13838.1 RNA polymerase RpoN-/SigL-like sigma 54 subunit [Roseateles depolymerans]
MRPTLQVRLSQHLALTPQLQQSIRLLQLSTLELHQEVEQMLASNPLLEPDEEHDTAAPPGASPAERVSDERVPDREERSTEGGESDGSGEATGAEEMRAEDFGTTERDDWENGTERDDFDGIREQPSSSAGSGSEDDERPETEAPDASLQDVLRAQMAGMHLGEVDRAALLALIESLNDDGYLEDPLEDLVRALLGEEAEDGADQEQREQLLDTFKCALKWLQSMEPAGVGARDLGECLELQLRTHPRSPEQALAIVICRRHLELLAKRDWRRLMSLTGADDDLLRGAQAMIATLEPKPGRRFARSDNRPVVPDVIVQKAGRGFRVMINPDVLPKLRINELYAQALRATRGGVSNSPLGGQLQEARWFIKNIQQRFDTILRVSEAIVERQRGFFTHGELAMKPLVLREIADELGLHESTISRVTTAKYMATPWGTFELKYFFGSSLSTEAGGNASSTAVRALIKQFIAAEDTSNPLSDSQLSTMLGEQGITVARRTVAKYREALKLAPANLRKSR